MNYTYNNFITDLTTYIGMIVYTGLTNDRFGMSVVSPSFYFKTVETCLDDEIEVNTGTTYPAVFIYPIPMTLTSNTINYSVRLYFVKQLLNNDKYQRVELFSELIESYKCLLQHLPDNMIPLYDQTITPFLKFDSMVDGFFVDLSISSSILCA